jgi:hypothetical protein
MPHEWAVINDLFHRALEEPPERRAAWLDTACGSNAHLRAEVESLLAAHTDARAILDGKTPATIGPYRILRAIGAGGMGVVYLAEDTRLGRRVALKALTPESTDDPVRRERLRREARAAAALSHPGIATVYAFEEIDGAPYIASEFVPGDTLREEGLRGPLSTDEATATGIALADALAAAHAHGLIHRDIKPENIVRTPQGGIKILDFGLVHDLDAAPSLAAALAGPRLTREGAVLGTPAYMSPEQIRQGPIDARSDLFAVGAVLYELATGTHPFADATPAATIANVLEREPRPFAGRLDPIVRRCLRKTPDARYASAAELRDALRDALEALRVVGGSASDPTSPGASAARPVLWWWQFHQAVTALAYVLLLAPLWYAKDWIGGASGLLIFLAALAAVLAATTLRLHLWFTVRWYPAEWPGQQRRSRPWIRAADVVFVATLLVTVGLTMTAHNRVAVLLVAAAVAVLVSFAIVEPATTRATFSNG